jgi:hypothetical protein
MPLFFAVKRGVSNSRPFHAQYAKFLREERKEIIAELVHFSGFQNFLCAICAYFFASFAVKGDVSNLEPFHTKAAITE